MERTDMKVRTSMRNFLLALALLLTTNILMGVTLMTMSKNNLRDQIEQRMLIMLRVMNLLLSWRKRTDST